MTRPSLHVDEFYRSSWQVIIALLAWLVVASNSARPQVALPFYVLAFLLVSPWAHVVKTRARLATYLLFAAVVTLVTDHLVTYEGFETVLRSMIELVSAFLPWTLLRAERARAYWFAVLNVAVVAIGCMTFSSSIGAYASFTLLIGAMILNLNAANLGLRDMHGERPVDHVPPTYFRQFFLVLPAGALGALLIFLAFPRVQSFSVSLGQMSGRNQSGYSGLISLAGSGPIEASQTLALMVVSPDLAWLRSRGPSLLFRGDALDSFDGHHWTSSIFDFAQLHQSGDHRVTIRHDSRIRSLTVHAEPSTTSAIFYPGALLDVVKRSNGMGPLLMNSAGSVMRSSYSFERLAYTVNVVEPSGDDVLPDEPVAQVTARLAASYVEAPAPYELSGKQAASYLALPNGLKAPGYLDAWMQSLAIDPAKDSPAQVLAKLRADFATHFKASLKNQFQGTDTLHDFLTVTREGHCEYFATASAVAMRKLGLPARVVVGYRGGAYNQYVDALEIREENAHAWVEVYLPKIGWHAFDPTPAATSGISEGLSSSVRMWTNAMAFYFRQYVIDYDYNTQRELVRSLRSLGRRQGSDDSKAGELLDEEYAVWIGGALALVALTGGLVFWRRKLQTRDDLPPYYHLLVRRAARLGYTREAGESLSAFNARLASGVDDASLVASVARAVERDLYAPHGLDQNAKAELLGRVRKTKLKRRAASR